MFSASCQHKRTYHTQLQLVWHRYIPNSFDRIQKFILNCNQTLLKGARNNKNTINRDLYPLILCVYLNFNGSSWSENSHTSKSIRMKVERMVGFAEVSEHEKGALVKIEPTHPKYIIRYSTSMEQAPLCSVTCCHKRDTT